MIPDAGVWLDWWRGTRPGIAAGQSVAPVAAGWRLARKLGILLATSLSCSSSARPSASIKWSRVSASLIESKR